MNLLDYIWRTDTKALRGQPRVRAVSVVYLVRLRAYVCVSACAYGGVF